jgi:hypothetical protein
MMTVRPAAAMAAAPTHGAHAAMGHAPQAAPEMMMGGQATQPPLPVMTLFSFLALAAGVGLGLLLRRM